MNTIKYPLAQRNPVWATKKLGSSSLTIGRYGCTTTSICNGLHYFGIYLTPDEIAKDSSSYTSVGLILWQNLKLPGGWKQFKRVQGRNDAAIQASLKAPNEFVLLEVDNGQHWVLATGKTLLGNDYKVDDSWFGDKRTACGTYHNITGSSHFKK